MAHWWRLTAAKFRDSLPVASTATILALLCAAVLVLWMTGRPEGGEWWDFHPKALEWKERLTIAGAVAAGAGAAIALVVGYRKQRDAEEGKFARAFADAAAQLGNESAAVRMAGAYALAALADRHLGRRQQCIDALCAYLRLKYTPEADEQNLTSTTRNREVGSTTATDTITYRADDREVRLTIIGIIRDHLQDIRAPDTWCGRQLDFTGVTFDGGDFTGAKFTGVTLFKGATFASGAVSFRRATFAARLGQLGVGDPVSFNGARFAGGTVSFDWATFSAGTVSFDWARFSARHSVVHQCHVLSR